MVADILALQGWRIDGFLDDRKQGLVGGLPVLGPFARAFAPGFLHGRAAIVALGDSTDRAAVSRSLLEHGSVLASAVHPSAVVARDAEIGAGSTVCAGAIIGVASRVGRFCIVNTAASVDHDCVLEEGAFLGPGVRLCGGVRIGAGAFIGAGAVMLPGSVAEPGATIPAGTLVKPLAA